MLSNLAQDKTIRFSWLYPHQWPNDDPAAARAKVDTGRSSPTRRARRDRAAIERVAPARGRGHQDVDQALETQMAKPQFSVSADHDVPPDVRRGPRELREAGVEGIGIWEFKLARGRQRRESVAKLRDSGLKATTASRARCRSTRCRSRALRIPAERTRGALRGDRALRAVRARGRPLPHRPSRRPGSRPGRGAARDRRGAAQGRASVAAEHGLTLGLEPLHREVYGTWSIVGDDPADDRPDRRDRRAERAGALRRLPPLGHRRRARAHRASTRSRIAPSVHICDWREETAERLRPRAARRRDHRPAGDLRRARGRRLSTAGSTSRSSRTTARSPIRTSRTRSGSRTPVDVVRRGQGGLRARPGRRGRPPA